MRLIDADELKEYLDKKYSFGIDLKFMLFDEIDNQPTAYDIDKVVKELGRASYDNTDWKYSQHKELASYYLLRTKDAIEIVEKERVRYNK